MLPGGMAGANSSSRGLSKGVQVPAPNVEGSTPLAVSLEIQIYQALALTESEEVGGHTGCQATCPLKAAEPPCT
jgi:hypothetical protein